MYHMFNGEFDLAQRLAEDLLRLSRQREDTAGLILGHYPSGLSWFFVGRFTLSRSHLEEVLALYEPVSHRSLVNHAGIHPHLVVPTKQMTPFALLCPPALDACFCENNEQVSGCRALEAYH